MKLNLKALGFAAGILWGAAVFLMTLISMGCGYADKATKAIASIYPGYSVSIGGSFIGLVYGFVDGFVCALLFGLIYNAFIKEQK